MKYPFPKASDDLAAGLCLSDVIHDEHEASIPNQSQRSAFTSVRGKVLLVLLFALIFLNRPTWCVGEDQIVVEPAIHVEPGVVVEEISPHSEGEIAGLQQGDILLAWSRGDSRGEIQSPFDLTEIALEQAPLGTVTLHGIRNAETKSWEVGPDAWGIQVRPILSEMILSAYLQARQSAKAGNLVKAQELWRTLEDSKPSVLLPWFHSWLLFRIAELQAAGRSWNESDQNFQESLQSAAGLGPYIRCQLLRAWGNSFEKRSMWSQAEKHYQQAAGEEILENLGLALDLDNIGRIKARRGDFAGAESLYLRSLHIRHRLSQDSIEVALSFNNLGNLNSDRGELDKAQVYYRQGLAILEKLAPGGLVAGTTLMGLGNVAFDRGDLVKASGYYEQALDIRERVAPGSLDVAKTLNALGNVAYRRGDLSASLEYYSRALDIKKTISPDSLSVASTLANLGNVAHDRGDLAQAEEYYRLDLEITKKLAPGSLDFAGSLMDMGIICHRRGNLVQAQKYYVQALEIKKKLAPDSLDLAYTLNNLGSVAQDQGDLALAWEYYRQTLEIRKKLAPGSLEVAHALNNLGEIALESDELVRAEDYNRQALEIIERLAPGSLDAAGSLENAGEVAQRRGDPRWAEECLQRALALREHLAPISVANAEGLNRLASLATDRGDLDGAAQYYRRASDIWEKLAPENANAAESLAGLAVIMRRRGRLDEAAQLFERALKAIESQTAQLGGAEEVRAGFRAKYENLYRGYAELLVMQGKVDAAFRLLELSHARTLLERLATAHIDVHKGVNPDLLAKERSLQSEIRAKSERRISLLNSEHVEREIKAVEKQIGDLTAEYEDVEAQIRYSSPLYAALTQPQTLNTKEVQEELLDSQTLLLEYALGDERSFVFVISAQSVQAFELPKRSEIEIAAMRVHSLLVARNTAIRKETAESKQVRVGEADKAYVKAASLLSRLVLGAVESQLGHQRLLIVADGALFDIPFAALPVPKTSGQTGLVPLIVDHEIVNLPSASVLAALRRERAARHQPTKEVAILADPVFDAEDARLKSAVVRGATKTRPNSNVRRLDRSTSGDKLTRSAADLALMRDGRVHLGRLLFTRREAKDIWSIIPSHQATVALDFRASRAFAIGGALSNYRIVHFATHALVDNQHPELSGLVLSLVNRKGKPQAGFLDLQDIYNLNLGADLVVLSACDTALGKQIGGEGMIGLTRGFLHAGAQGVVGTLWKVEDFATATFMRIFYAAMEQDRMPPAQALRLAQLSLWKEKHWSAPYYWSTFVLQGDWR